MGFFFSNVSGLRTPYRADAVQPIERTGEDKQDQHQRQFKQEDEAEHQQKFLKASAKLYKERSVGLASQIMNERFHTLSHKLSLKEAYEEIKNKNIQYYPVVSEEGKLLGLLSEREILMELHEGEAKHLGEIVSKETLCADPTTSIDDILQVFSKHAVDAVPVVNEEHQIVGILSRKELLDTILKVSKSLEVYLPHKRK